MMKKWMSILLIALFALSFAACANSDSIVGNWVADYDSVMAAMNASEREYMESTMGITKDNYYQEIRFQSDGTGTMIVKMLGSDWSRDFTYTADGDTLTITETMRYEYTYSLNGRELTMTHDGKPVVYRRK